MPSENFSELFPRYVAVAQDLSDESRADRLASVNGNDRHPPVPMAEKVMASSDAHDFEAETPQCRNQILSCDPRQSVRHATRTR